MIGVHRAQTELLRTIQTLSTLDTDINVIFIVIIVITIIVTIIIIMFLTNIIITVVAGNSLSEATSVPFIFLFLPFPTNRCHLLLFALEN